MPPHRSGSQEISTGIRKSQYEAAPVEQHVGRDQAGRPRREGQRRGCILRVVRPAQGSDPVETAAIYGSAYGTSGFNLAVPSLASGTWDITVFIWPSGASGFTTARVVRITIP